MSFRPATAAWTRRFSVFAGVAVLTILSWQSYRAVASAWEDTFWDSLVWRSKLYAQKATGKLPNFSWAELWHMTSRRRGFGLSATVNDDVSLLGSVRNPHITDSDRRAGARIFRAKCQECHGQDGSGGMGPSLDHSGLSHGDSDLALYAVIRDGIPNTAMAATDLSVLQRWQVVTFIRTLQLRLSNSHETVSPSLKVRVHPDELHAPNTSPEKWLTYSGSLDGHRYTPLSEISPGNVSELRLRWTRPFETSDKTIEATPLVAAGVIFTTYPPANVLAIEASSGRVLWSYSHQVPPNLPLCCRRVNRGLAILGTTLFLGSLGGELVAISANTGRVLWQVRVAEPAQGYTMTGAPLIANGSVIVGVAGGEFAIRGFLAAYDPVTGKQRWKFSTVPSPGEFGHETWENDAWRTGGGPTWVTGSYDPDLDLVYWGVGNPAPDFAAHTRPGDNLFTNSVVALHAGTGKLAWHFQFTPHDENDWDSNQTPILADLVIRGRLRKTICWANRNGFYYVLDRTTGEFLVGVPFVELNWAAGLDFMGRPILAGKHRTSSTGRLVRPGSGGTNWQNAAFDAGRRLVFVPATEGAGVFTASAYPPPKKPGTLYLGSGSGFVELATTPIVRALDAATGARRWEYFSPQVTEEAAFSGLLATGGGLVFGASGGFVFALDADTGREVWRIFLGGDTRAAPISFTIEGRQVIAVSAGRALFLFGL